MNDCTIAAAYVIKKYGVKKVAYLDVDAHAGDGTAYINYNLPNVLTISIHQHPRTLFPGTCYHSEIGEGEGEGYCINVPIFPYTSEEPYMNVLNELVGPILKDYKPEVLITQLGVDSHYTDPLTALALSTSTYKKIAKFIHEISHECNSKWLALGGGGYSPDIVGKSWMIYFAEMAEKDYPDKLPENWINFAKELGIKVNNNDVIEDFNIESKMKTEDVKLVNERTGEIIQAIKDLISPYYNI